MKKYMLSIVVAIGIVGCGGSVGVNSPSNSSSSNQNSSHATSSSGVNTAKIIGKGVRDRYNSKVSQKQSKAILDAQNRQSKMPNQGPRIPPIPGI